METPLKDLLLEIRRVEPFPDIAARVLELAAREDVVPSDLVEVVQTDPGLTLKVLGLCNSAYYGFEREISSLREAGNLLGVSTLVNLVLTSTASRYFRDYGRADRRTMERRWEQCVATAIGARILASRASGVDPERAYTAGLLENVGHLVLDRFVEERAAAIRDAAEAGARLIDAEKEVLGMHHAEIGARLTTRWSLPDVLVDVIRHHHHPERASSDPTLAATVHLAEVLAQDLYADASESDPLLYEVSEAACELLGVVRADLDELQSQLGEEMARARAFVAS
ncbi:MAG: HDOD domain-containing protein [Planctomycetota bacterium]